MEGFSSGQDVGVTVKTDWVVDVEPRFAMILRAVIVYRSGIEAMIEIRPGPKIDTPAWQELTGNVFGGVHVSAPEPRDPTLRLAVKLERGSTVAMDPTSSSLITRSVCRSHYVADDIDGRVEALTVSWRTKDVRVDEVVDIDGTAGSRSTALWP